MTAHAKAAPRDKTLDELHAERADLLAQKARIAELRGKDTADDDFEAAVAAAKAYADREAERQEKWFDGGCTGPRPVAPFGEMERIEARKMKAIAALDHSKSARAALDVREAEINRELARLAGEIEAEAARYMGFSFGELGTRAAKLQEELDAIGAELLAGRHYFKALAEKSYDDTRHRESVYDYAERAATLGLVHLSSIDERAFTARSFPLADRTKVAEVEARFRQLCEGELTS